MGAYLIIGASGFIGRHLYDCCKMRQLEVIGTYHNHHDEALWIKYDLCTDELEEICYKYFNGRLPEALILCSANTSIDGCKRNEYASNKLNVEGTQRILKQADDLGIKSVFLSSEAVFDGEKGMYKEEDIPNPVTLYGRQKLDVEQYITENIKDYLIFRISRATGSRYGENDIFDEFYHKIINNKEIVCLKDQSFCVTEVDDIVQCIMKSLEKNLRGLYHISSHNYISRYELAKLYAEKIFGGYEKIVEEEYSKMQFFDNRHIYGGLNGSKLETLIGINYMDISDILNHYLETKIIMNERKDNERRI